MALGRQTEDLKVFPSIVLAALLTSAALVSDPPLVKAILVLLALVVLLGGSVRGQQQ